jgi:glycosyltransferase involved in cell wall biosynthesis
MKVVICWPQISAYMAACWRALARCEGVSVFVLAFSAERDAAFSQATMAGLSCELLDPVKRQDAAYVRECVAAQSPDVVVIPGWLHAPYSALAMDPALASVKFVMGIDTPFSGSWRQRLARLKIGRLIDRMDLVVVAGERAFRLARYLKVPEEKILRGVYGYDDESLAHVQQERAADWPRSFLYVGRYVEDKAIDVLLEGYARYRNAVDGAWPLTCCGTGEMDWAMGGAAGVTDVGFVQPGELPEILLRHGVFVLASRFEPWGVALAEAMASGLPAICTEACGASIDLVRHLHNGVLIPTDDAEALARAMGWMHAHADRLPEMGRRAREFAIPFSAQRWAERWHERLLRLNRSRFTAKNPTAPR